jgi:hypothetical protein
MARGDFEQSAASFRRAVEIDPNWTWGYIKLARALARGKKCPEAMAQCAIAEARIAGGAAPLSRSWLGANYALCGETARALHDAEQGRRVRRDSHLPGARRQHAVRGDRPPDGLPAAGKLSRELRPEWVRR